MAENADGQSGSLVLAKAAKPAEDRETGGSAVLEALLDPRNELSLAWDREYNSYLMCRLQALVRSEFSESTWRAFTLRV